MLSFRLLASRVLARTGGAADGTLDAGGKLLMMQRALQEALPSLTVYARPSRKAPFLAELVALCDELQVCRVEPERLGEVWSGLGGLTGEKVRDLSLIYAAYLHRLKGEGQDRRDLMTRLGEELEASGYAEGKDVFLDGFTYFTAQELAVIAILLRRARSVTITLLGERDSDLEIFRQSLRARDRLVRLADREGAECRVVYLPSRPPETALEHLEANFFGGSAKWDGDCQVVKLYRAESLFSEAEYVASEILTLVRTGKYRFRDVAVAARNLEEYAPVIESVFERYGVPVYVSRRSDVLEKPVLSLIAAALDAVSGGYEYEDMFRYLKTGLAGLTAGECDRLENYVIAWDVHGAMWVREEDWTANPAGWEGGLHPGGGGGPPGDQRHPGEGRRPPGPSGPGIEGAGRAPPGSWRSSGPFSRRSTCPAGWRSGQRSWRPWGSSSRPRSTASSGSCCAPSWTSSPTPWGTRRWTRRSSPGC